MLLKGQGQVNIYLGEDLTLQIHGLTQFIYIHVWVAVVFSCHWSFRGIVITSKFNLGFNTDTAVVLYFYETICF